MFMEKIMLFSGAIIQETFDDFMLSRKTKGLADKTLESYQNQFKSVSKHLDISMSIFSLQKKELNEMIVSMREHGLSSNTINCYTRMLKSFFSWCNKEGITDLNINLYKCEETIKETYTDKELEKLLRKPDMRKSDFGEYRNWVIINFLMNSGSRAATIRAIQNRDVDLENGVVFYRHTKNKKVQAIPLCSAMVSIFREYMRIRKGKDTDYLFCNQYGQQLSESALRQSIVRYNHKRGVQKTSIHLFRHTFARKYLIDCGGDAFTLQKLLGHSTLKMTKHYCNIFDADLTKNFDNFSPLAQIKSNSERIKMNKR
ncbi:MAG: site-specific integrase [Ruminococcaceae bacterium]|nr:site-specific integrase [Oscillospiraceae bacterium]